MTELKAPGLPSSGIRQRTTGWNRWSTAARNRPGWAEAFEYRLGNRSALECVIDQYPVSTDARSGIVSDPNREDDAEYIVRLVGQVVRVSIETMRIINGLPGEFAER